MTKPALVPPTQNTQPNKTAPPFCWVGRNTTQQNSGFVGLGRGRGDGGAWVGLPSLGPGAVGRPRPSFGGAAPPRAALRRALPLAPPASLITTPHPPTPAPRGGGAGGQSGPTAQGQGRGSCDPAPRGLSHLQKKQNRSASNAPVSPIQIPAALYSVLTPLDLAGLYFARYS